MQHTCIPLQAPFNKEKPQSRGSPELYIYIFWWEECFRADAHRHTDHSHCMNKWSVLSVWCTQLSSTEFKCSSAFLEREDWKLKSFKGLVYYRYHKQGEIFVLLGPIKKDWLQEFVGIPFLPSVLFFCQRKLLSRIKFKEAGVISDVSFSNRKATIIKKERNVGLNF